MTESRNEEMTFYRFYSEIRAFLTKLLKNPIKATPTKYLEDMGLTQKRLIKMLRDNNIIKRDEKILVPGKDKVKHVTYSVKYTLKSDKFEDKVENIYNRYFSNKKLKESAIKRKIMENLFRNR